MLVLSRKVFEEIVIGDDIVVSVERIRGNVVAIGISAPKPVRIMRRELLGDGGPPLASRVRPNGDQP